VPRFLGGAPTPGRIRVEALALRLTGHHSDASTPRRFPARTSNEATSHSGEVAFPFSARRFADPRNTRKTQKGNGATPRWAEDFLSTEDTERHGKGLLICC